MSLSTWLLCDSLEKGGPGSGPHVLSAGALSSLQRLAQDDTHEGRLAAEKLKEYQDRQHSSADFKDQVKEADRASDAAYKFSNSFKMEDANNRSKNIVAAAMHDKAASLHAKVGNAETSLDHQQQASSHSYYAKT